MEPASQVGRPPITAGYQLPGRPSQPNHHRLPPPAQPIPRALVNTCSSTFGERPHCIFAVGFPYDESVETEVLSSCVRVCRSRPVVVLGSLRLRR